MNISIPLKLALFSFLSAIACTIANSFILLIELDYIAECFLFLAYICLVIWVCKYINRAKRLSKNLVVSFFTFAVAVYSGIYSTFTEDTLPIIVSTLTFYASTLLCLLSVVVLFGRLIFGKPAKAEAPYVAPEAAVPDVYHKEEVSDVPLEAELPTLQTVPQSVCMWTCSCGCINASNFCPDCGAVKPKIFEESEE